MTQNQGNVLGDRPCVRQSKLFRQHDAGNAMKDLMGQSHLSWKTNVQEGAYAGMRVYDHNAPGNVAPIANEAPKRTMAEQPVNKPEPQAVKAQPVAAAGTRQSYHYNNRDAGFNFFTGEAK